MSKQNLKKNRKNETDFFLMNEGAKVLHQFWIVPFMLDQDSFIARAIEGKEGYEEKEQSKS